jgi:hypothetical protein
MTHSIAKFRPSRKLNAVRLQKVTALFSMLLGIVFLHGCSGSIRGSLQSTGLACANAETACAPPSGTWRSSTDIREKNSSPGTPSDSDGAGIVAPALFFSDLDSGPSTGNSDNSGGQSGGHDGAIVTIWGARLGNTQRSSKVLYDGAPVARILYWGPANLDDYQKISFQLSASANTGPGKITVVVDNVSSNPLPFNVRAGNIYFVSPTGRDGSRGSYSSPWKTVVKARDSMKPGDIAYALDGLNQTTEDSEGWNAVLTLRTQWCSASGYPRALVAYPGAHATIGNTSAERPAFGIRTTDKSGGPCAGNWTFAGLTLRGLAPAAISGPSNHWRFVGNDISCPNAKGQGGGGACFHASMANGVKFYGNVVHDAGAADASALFHGVYFSTDSNHADIGWNTIANVHGCRGIQIHSTPLGSDYPDSGTNMYDVQIHDNLIHDTQCDGMVIDTIDPSKGPVSIFNNVIYNAGKGPNNPEHTGGWSCIYIRASTEKGALGSGVVEVYGNTLYSCGTFANPPYKSADAGFVLGGNPNLSANLRNNIFYQIANVTNPTGVPYLVIWNPTVPNGGAACSPQDDCPWMKGSRNLFFGSGPMNMNPKHITGSLNVDPQFANAAKMDFHISARSPAAKAGVPTPSATDHDGVPLNDKSGYPVGAYAAVP